MKIPTQRDLQIIFDLYRYRTLSGEQLKMVHFREKPGYFYRKLALLKDEGFIDSYRSVPLKNNKRGGCYYVTEKGIDVLEEFQLVEQSRRARDNKVQGPALPHIIEINELYAQLTHYGWRFNPSREVKSNNGMNRSSLIKGSLIDSDNNEHMVYLLEEMSREETIDQITREIQAHDFEHVLLLCKGRESYFNMKKKLERIIIGGSVNILPYPFALKALRLINGKRNIEHVFNGFGPIKPIQTKNEFTRYVIDHQGEEKYVTNYLTGDQIAKYFLTKYAYDRYQMEGKKVLLFAWKGQLPELQEEFKSYPHVEIVMVQMPEKQIEEVL